MAAWEYIRNTLVKYMADWVYGESIKIYQTWVMGIHNDVSHWDYRHPLVKDVADWSYGESFT